MRGAQIIDINMGCPAKKVCNRDAGSALLRDEPLVARILAAVVSRGRRAGDAEDPHRLGPRPRATRVRIARIAEDAGIAALAVHGRTRACRFEARPNTRRSRSQAARADPGLCERRHRLAGEGLATCCAAPAPTRVMIGRAAQGRPWIFREIEARLAGDDAPPTPRAAEVGAIMRAHLRDLYAFYGEAAGGQDRAQAHRMVLPGSRRRAALSSIRDAGGDGRGAAGTGAGLFRRTGRDVRGGGLSTRAESGVGANGATQENEDTTRSGARRERSTGAAFRCAPTPSRRSTAISPA